MRKKYILAGLTGGLVLAVAIGGTWAAFHTSTENNAGTGIAQITTKSIDVTQIGTVKSGMTISNQALPGNDYDCEYSVKNSVEGENACDIYLKVTIYKYWENQELDGSYASICYQDGTNQESYELSQTDDKTGKATVKNGWMVQLSDAEELVLYYTKPLEQGESTTNFMDAVEFSEKMNNDYTGQTLQLEFEVDAVQTDSAEDAMQAEFGTFPLIDDSGIILNVFETRQERDSYR